jgi:hypothetical protein
MMGSMKILAGMVALTLAFANTAHAAGFPPYALLAGSMQSTGVFGKLSTDCQLGPLGPMTSFFKRNANKLLAEITFPTIKYDVNFSNNTTYYIGGLATLSFTSATAGKMAFTPSTQTPFPPANVTNPTFAKYAQSYNASTQVLNVSFEIVFPNCTVPVVAIYRN